MHRPRKSQFRRRSSVTVILLATIAMVGVSCAPAPGGGGGTPAPLDFCEFWANVQETPPASNQAVLVKEGVVAFADETSVAGSDCNDPGAEIALAGAVVAEGTEVTSEIPAGGAVLAAGMGIPSELGADNPDQVAAVTGEEIGFQEPVLENIELQSLSAQISASGISVSGSVAVTISGVTSTIGFSGTLASLEDWWVTLSSSSFTIPGVTTAPVVFSGALRVANGVPSLELHAFAPVVEVGDITVSGASIDLTASEVTGVDASIDGTVEIGPSTVSGSVELKFDVAGALVYAQADMAVHLVGHQVGGGLIDLQGTVNLEGNADETVVSFSGSGVVGDLVVNAANGELTLAQDKATFVGLLDIAQGDDFVRFEGSLVWDGITAYVPYLHAQASAGEFSGVLQSGLTVTASGTMQTVFIDGQLRSVLTGDFQIGTLNASGTAIVEVSGVTTVLYVDADLVGAGFNANLGGAAVFTDGVATQVELSGTVNGAMQFGDLTLQSPTLNIEAGSGDPMHFSFSGGMQIGSMVSLTSTSVDALFGPDGGLLSLQAAASGSLQLDGFSMTNFQGSVVANPDQVTVTGSGRITVSAFPNGITFEGTLTSASGQPTWLLEGTASLDLGPIHVEDARVSLSPDTGLKAIRAGFYAQIIGIGVYVEADIFILPSGECSHIDLTGGSSWLFPVVDPALEGAVGCTVNH